MERLKPFESDCDTLVQARMSETEIKKPEESKGKPLNGFDVDLAKSSMEETAKIAEDFAKAGISALSVSTNY